MVWCLEHSQAYWTSLIDFFFYQDILEYMFQSRMCKAFQFHMVHSGTYIHVVKRGMYWPFQNLWYVLEWVDHSETVYCGVLHILKHAIWNRWCILECRGHLETGCKFLNVLTILDRAVSSGPYHLEHMEHSGMCGPFQEMQYILDSIDHNI